ncbi:hypothetical protein B0T10DRAFT_534021 [Thelonectria olida]|uniref:Uncharacterized protein n=1 Tax=Thelonectria olida TaxID=1576542 RepID=A0A9P8VPX4_9HYPO|nr:hypothetical protein B0T10DRAFT_534021 [Thelonectria olida]
MPPETRAHIDYLLEREEKHLDAKKQPRLYSKALGDNSFAVTSLWLERTRWPITYKNVRRDILQAITQLPNRTVDHSPCPGDANNISLRKDEQKILCFLGAINAMLDRCELTAQNTNRVLLCWLASSRLDIYQPKPFALTIKESTQKRYRLLWKQFITEQEVKIRLGQGQFINTTGQKWPRMRHCENAELDLFLRHGTPQSDDASSLSDDKSNGDFESSEDEYDDFEESESEDSLDDWVPDLTRQDAPDDSQLYEGLDYKVKSGPAVASINKFLKLLFQLSFALSTEPFIDGEPGSILLVYFSSILGFSSNYRQFQLGPGRLIFLKYALPLYLYPTIGIQQRPHMLIQRLNDI